MADITNSVTSTSNALTGIIFWITNTVSNIISGIGTVEIVLGVLVGLAIYFFFQQHNLQPVRYRRF